MRDIAIDVLCPRQLSRSRLVYGRREPSRGGLRAASSHLWTSLRAGDLVVRAAKRLTRVQTDATLRAVGRLRVSIDADHDERRVDLARTRRLTAYDAAYLEVAIRRALPLASLDRRLRDAAAASGVPLLSEPGA